MPTHPLILATAAFFGAILLGLTVWFYQQVPPSRAFVRNRPERPDTWRARYTGDDLAMASDVLEALCEAFLLRSSDKWRLFPDDRIGDIYRAQYPPKLGLPDALETEILFDDLHDRFGLSEQTVRCLYDRDASIAEVIGLCIQVAAAQVPGSAD